MFSLRRFYLVDLVSVIEFFVRFKYFGGDGKKAYFYHGECAYRLNRLIGYVSCLLFYFYPFVFSSPSSGLTFGFLGRFCA